MVKLDMSWIGVGSSWSKILSLFSRRLEIRVLPNKDLEIDFMEEGVDSTEKKERESIGMYVGPNQKILFEVQFI